MKSAKQKADSAKTHPSPGDTAPDFILADKDTANVSLSSLRGNWVVLYFYPKDNTGACTMEAIDFTARVEALARMGAVVLGISPDSPESHCRFHDKHSLGIRLLSDGNREIARRYGAWGVKMMYGKEVTGIIRSTFIIDPEGVVRHTWRKVKVPGHAEEVIRRLEELL